MIYTEEDFRLWIARNKMHFLMEGYTACEAGSLARLVGFDPEMVYRTLSHYEMALAGRSIDRIAAAKSNWFVSSVQEPKGLDLSEQWEALSLQLTDGIDFE